MIAIEIFINITVYLREDVIHVKIVMATALMAIARKVIILDLEKIEPEYLWGYRLGGDCHQHRLLVGGQAAAFRS